MCASDSVASFAGAYCTVSSYMCAQTSVSSLSTRHIALLAKPTLRPTVLRPAARRIAYELALRRRMRRRDRSRRREPTVASTIVRRSAYARRRARRRARCGSMHAGYAGRSSRSRGTVRRGLRRARSPKASTGGDERHHRAAVEAHRPAAGLLVEQRADPAADDRRDALRRVEHGVVRRRVLGAEVVSRRRREQRVDLAPREVDGDQRGREPAPEIWPSVAPPTRQSACSTNVKIIVFSRPSRSDAQPQKMRLRAVGQRAQVAASVSIEKPHDLAIGPALAVTSSPPVAISTNAMYIT